MVMRRIFIIGILTLTCLVPGSALAAENQPSTLFLPGIFGSRLYAVEESGDQTKIWDGLAGEKMRRLAMDTEGNSIEEIRVGSILHYFSAFSFNFIEIYAPLFEKFRCYTPAVSLKSNVQHLAAFSFEQVIGNDGEEDCVPKFISYPYDWRKDVFDVVDDGTTYTNGSNVHLIDIVEELANNSTGKINILAHSNGGLLAKALMIRLEERGLSHLVDKIILVGSPQLGTPKSIGAMLHGHEQGVFGGFVKDKAISRLVSLNSPGAYSLLPSEMFIEENEPVITFTTSPATTKYTNIFGSAIDSYTELFDFLTGTKNNREQPEEDDLHAPAKLNEDLLRKAETTHGKIDAWVPPATVDFVQVVGIGNETEHGFNYYSKQVFTQKHPGSLIFHKPWVLRFEPKFSNDGDSEVIAAASESNSGEIYYFDFEDLDEAEDRIKDHTSFLEEETVLAVIEQILKGETISSPYVRTTEEDAGGSENSIAVSVHSPVAISATDSSGNVSEIAYDTDSDLFETNMEIPGSFARIIGESKYIFLPEGDYDITITGLDTGSFDLNLSEILEDGSLETIESLDQIPTKEDSVATTSITADSISALSVDINNDSEADYVFSNESSNKETIATQLESSLLELSIRPQLKSAIEQYFELWENTNDTDEKANYMAQIKRIVAFLSDRYITQDTGNTWTALAEHLQ